ncbi:hypothetical protein BDV24DRAFT_139003 [Aspergillus arachidicola]|uniref:Uncharacterized protein n=1 Tax=Aspergillus arachidicola TaxID=656916 RepID=A0A5N6XXV3_9EURO|nr:hypothetical protein BDV24DRAFT_139003 [Aspergillus arachidicola]
MICIESQSKRPLVLIAHRLGGPLVDQALSHSVTQQHIIQSPRLHNCNRLYGNAAISSRTVDWPMVLEWSLR